MSYTVQDIQDKLNKRIDYQEIIRLLELDLNTIAAEVITDPEQFIEFKVFFDSDEFDTTINLQGVGEGNGFFITPVMLQLIGGDYATEKGPEVFQVEFRIETFAMQQDLDNIRKVLEIYSSLNQGGITKDVFANALTSSITDFPVVSEPFQYKGFTRISAFMSWILTIIYSGQLANEVGIKIDGDDINLLSFNINRTRTNDSIHRNTASETSTINKSQLLVFNCGMIYDNSDIAKKMFKNIKDLNSNMNQSFYLTVQYPILNETDTYNVILTDGDIQINAGGYVTLTFTLTLA